MRRKHAKLDKLNDEVLKKIDAISDGTTNPKELENLRKIELTQEGLSNRMELLILKSFTLYQQLLSLMIRA